MSITPENRQHCAATRNDGAPCQALATSTGLCLAHDPRSAEWRVLGGKARSSGNRAAKMLPSRLRPIAEGLERAFWAVESGALDVKQAHAMATLASALVRVFQASEFEQRIRLLEQQANDQQLYTGRGGRPIGDKGMIQWPTNPSGA